MKKLIFALFAATMIIGNINVCLAEDAFDKGLIIKGDQSGNDVEPSRQIDKLIKGTITNGSVEFEFDNSLRITEVIVKKENSEVLIKREEDYLVKKKTRSNFSSRPSLIIHKSELGVGNFRVDFINEDGSRAYTSFSIFTIK